MYAFVSVCENRFSRWPKNVFNVRKTIHYLHTIVKWVLNVHNTTKKRIAYKIRCTQIQNKKKRKIHLSVMLTNLPQIFQVKHEKFAFSNTVVKWNSTETPLSCNSHGQKIANTYFLCPPTTHNKKKKKKAFPVFSLLF